MTTAVYRNPACSRLGGDGITCPRSHGHTAVNKKSVPSWILCFQFEDFVHLSLHLSRPVSASCWRDDIYSERILNRLLWVEDYAFSMVSTTAQWVVLLVDALV